LSYTSTSPIRLIGMVLI